MTMVDDRKLSRRERRAQRKIETAVMETPSSQTIRTLVASAVDVRVTQSWSNIRWGGTDWQAEGWLHYDTCPEFHTGVSIGAGNISRARLIGVEIDPETNEPGTQPTDNPVVTDIMGQLFGGPSGQSQALAALYRHLDVAGDSWILATDQPDVDQSPWEILSTTEVTGSAGRIMVEQINGLPRPVDFERELLIRVWAPHPKRRWEADAPTRALLPVLRELAALTAMVSATVKSRLASAGILWLPDDISLPPSIDDGGDTSNTQTRVDAAGGAEGWLDLITEAMTAPIRDPDSASAVVPMVAQVRGASIDKIRWDNPGRDLDQEIEPLRQSGVKRLAVGMNLPPEVLLGLGDVNHWTAWAITEDYARAYLAPKLELIADALTQFYLRPALRAAGVDPDSYAVYFDLDKLLPKQVSKENADAAWSTGHLSVESYFAALGFSTKDMAQPQERLERLIVEMFARANPEILDSLAPTLTRMFPTLIIDPIIPPNATVQHPVAGGESTAPQAPPPRALPGAPAPTLPPTDTPAGAGGA